MPQAKDIKVQTHIEKTVHDAMLTECAKLCMTSSRFVRMVLIRDLRKRGLLSDRAIAAMSLEGFVDVD
jgi:hypothetical protein